MKVKDLKKELSKLSGVDFFNPKYRDVFKKYFPDDASESEPNDNEEDRLKEVLGEENTEESKAQDTQENETTEETKETTESEETKADEEQGDNADEETDTETTEEQTESDDSANEETTESSESAEEPSADDSSDSSEKTETTETSADDGETEEETASTNEDNSATETTDSTDNTSNELLETKVELQLVKAGVRDDRLESAKKLFMSDIKSLEDLDKLKDLIKQYPEWLKKEKPDAKPFGMNIGDNEGVLTAEEKRLKAMGINPKD